MIEHEGGPAKAGRRARSLRPATSANDGVAPTAARPRGYQLGTARLPHLLATLDEITEGIVLLGPGLRIRYHNERARDWIARYFRPAGAKRGRLPDRLHRWVYQHQSSARDPDAACPSFLLTQDGTALKGRLILHEDDLSLILEERRDPATASDLLKLGISTRESEVLRWAAKGKTNESIADILRISQHTVARHMERIFQKLNVENRTAAARFVFDVYSEKVAAAAADRSTL